MMQDEVTAEAGHDHADPTPDAIEDIDRGTPVTATNGNEVPSPEGTLDDLAVLVESRLRESLTRIDEMRRAAQMARTRLESELQIQRRRAGNAEDRLRQLEINLEQSREGVEEQRITCAELTTVLRAAEHRISALEKTVAARDQQIAALRTADAVELEQLQVQRQHLESRLTDAQRELSSTRERLKSEMAALSQERSALAAEVDALERRLQNRADENLQLQEQLQRARESAAETGEGGSGDVAARSGAEIAAVTAAVEEQEAAQAEEMRRLSARCEELDEIVVRRDHRLRELEETLEIHSREGREHRDRAEELARERGELQGLVDALASEAKQLRRDLVEAAQAEKQGTEQRRLIEARVVELEETLRSNHDHEAALQASVADAQTHLQKEQMTTAFLRGEVQSQARMLQSLEAELTDARARASAFEIQIHGDSQQHVKQLAKANDRSHALEAERNALTEQVANLTALKERLERELDQQRRRAEMERQKAEMARLQAKLEEIESRHPDAIRRQQAAPVNGDLHVGRSVTSVASDGGVPIIAIGASTGGPAALGEVLRLLPSNFAACILIVQHMPAGYTAEMASCLDQSSQISVAEARHNDPLRAGTAYVAPGGHHMEIRDGVIRLSTSPPVNKHRPSVDVLFTSLIPVATRVCAVLLTGMGQDGVAGMTKLLEAGAETVVQNEASSVVWGMPGAAVKAGCASVQLPPLEIGKLLLGKISSPAPNSYESDGITATPVAV